MLRRRKMNILIIVLGILTLLCLGYYLFAASYAGVTSTFLWFWLMLAICLIIVIALIILNKKYNWLSHIPKIIKIVTMVIFMAGVTIFVTMEGLIISKMNSEGKDNLDYIIVLGAQVRGERVTKSLAKRLDAAYDYLIENPDTLVICSGGQGSGEDISEALAMKRYLVSKGISEDRIIMEDKSKNTYENLKFSLEIIENKEASIAVVTNNFHVYRAMHLARYVGFSDVSGIAGESDNRLLPNYMIREGIALFKDLLVY